MKHKNMKNPEIISGEPENGANELKSALELAMERTSPETDKETDSPAKVEEPVDESDKLYTAAELAMRKTAVAAENEEKPADESDKLYTVKELVMQKDHEPFRGTIKYPYQKEKTEEEDRKEFEDKKYAGISINKEVIDKVLAFAKKEELAGAGSEQKTEAPQVEAVEERIIDNPFNKRIIEGSDSFENLALRIRVNNISIKGSQGEYSPQQLADAVVKVKSREWPLNKVTKGDGFREKLSILLKADDDARRWQETSTEIEKMFVPKQPEEISLAAELTSSQGEKKSRWKFWQRWQRKK
jgi:hypothetical protein